jgi:hypothetical protein
MKERLILFLGGHLDLDYKLLQDEINFLKAQIEFLTNQTSEISEVKGKIDELLNKTLPSVLLKSTKPIASSPEPWTIRRHRLEMEDARKLRNEIEREEVKR